LDPPVLAGEGRGRLPPLAKTSRSDSEFRQDKMQALVGIVRREEEMKAALDEIVKLKERAGQVKVEGNRDYNPGWHTSPISGISSRSRSASPRAAIERKESRGGHFRDDSPRNPRTAHLQPHLPSARRHRRHRPAAISEMPAHLKEAVEENK